jgi:orotidine-5'-phosphate decarboxylase
METKLLSGTERIIVAMDVPSTKAALALADQLREGVGIYKIGLELFVAEGPAIVRAFTERELPVFLDLKLHDIPNTVAAAVHSAAGLGVRFLTVHTSGGPAMLRAAADAASGTGITLLGVTVLTSMDDQELAQVGCPRTAGEQVLRLAEVAKDSGLRGLVCSPLELRSIRERWGNDFTLVTPGVRPAGASVGDQKRFMTPRAAIEAGADYLVVGRPITADPDPAEAARRIAEECSIP